jgi:uncharacterized membrane protein
MYLPLTLPYLGLLGLALIILIVLLEIGIIEAAYYKLGMSHRSIILLLIATLLGSFINIPVATVTSGKLIHNRIVIAHGMAYVIPHVMVAGRTLIAVNVGGALIPVLVCVYLLVRIGGWLAVIPATAAVTAVVYHFSRVVPGLGITVPTLLPGITAAVLAIILSRQKRAAVAYVAGTLGCLLGADVLNLPAYPQFHAPVASIGGAGTFDGVFLSGIIAVLLA